MTISFEAGDQAKAVCPSCGSCNSQPETWARDTAMIADALAGAAIAIGELIGKSSPQLGSRLVAAGRIGLALGALAGSAVGSIFRRHRCVNCGEEFSD